MAAPCPQFNLALRLRHRETYGHPPGAAVLQTEAPNVHVCRFTPDGHHLVCFGANFQHLALFDYTGPAPPPQSSSLPSSANEGSITFDSFFRQRYSVPICCGNEQLCRTFCISLLGGRYLLLASQTPRLSTADAAAAEAPAQPSAPSCDVAEWTTFHVVSIATGEKTGERRFAYDFFDLPCNGCISLFDDHMAILSVQGEGQLLDSQVVGPSCFPDDELAIQLMEDAERRWRREQQAGTSGSSSGGKPAGWQTLAASSHPDDGAAAKLAQLANGRVPAERVAGVRVQGGANGALSHAGSGASAANAAAGGPSRAISSGALGGLDGSPEPWAADEAGDGGTAIRHAGSTRRSAASPVLIQGVLQRLLAHVCLSILEGRPTEVAADMSAFHKAFNTLHSLAIWKAKLLDRDLLLLALAPPLPANTSAAPPGGAPPPPRLLLIYDVRAASVRTLFRSPCEELARAFVSQPEAFLVSGRAMCAWERMAAATLYAPTLLGALRTKLATGTAAERAALARKLIAGLPFVSQALCLSPYLDSKLYSYDDKQLSVIQRLREAGPHPIKFVPVSGQRARAPARGRSAAQGVEGAAVQSQHTAASQGGLPHRPANGGPCASGSSAAPRQAATGPSSARTEAGDLPLKAEPLPPSQQPRSSNAPASSSSQCTTSMPRQGQQGEGTPHAAACAAIAPAPASAAAEVHTGRRAAAATAPRRVSFSLDPAPSTHVTVNGQTFARRVLRLFHPTDPFVLTVVQSFVQPTTLDIFFRSADVCAGSSTRA